jgi:hypothetical protein
MQLQAGNNDEQRGFANARNAKLHHLAKQKRVSKGGQAARLSSNHPTKPVLLTSVLAQTPQMFDSFKVRQDSYSTAADCVPFTACRNGATFTACLAGCCIVHTLHTADVAAACSQHDNVVGHAAAVVAAP